MKPTFHISIVLPVILLTFTQSNLAQSKKAPRTSRHTQTKKPVTPSSIYPLVKISDHERQIIDEINLARTSPAKYAQNLKLFRTYYKGNLIHFPDGHTLQTNEGIRAVDEAIAFFEISEGAAAF